MRLWIAKSQSLDRIYSERKSSADCCENWSTLEDLAPDSMSSESPCQRQPSEATANDGDEE